MSLVKFAPWVDFMWLCQRFEPSLFCILNQRSVRFCESSKCCNFLASSQPSPKCFLWLVDERIYFSLSQCLLIELSPIGCQLFAPYNSTGQARLTRRGLTLLFHSIQKRPSKI